MRLLVVAPFLPDAHARHGGGIYLASLGEALARRAEVGLVALARRQETTDGESAFSYQATVSLPGWSAAERGIAHKARMAWHWAARRLPLVVAKHWQPDMPRALARALAEFRPDAVLLEQASMAQYLPWLRSVHTVLTDHEAGAPDRPVTGLGAWADRRDHALWRRYVRRCYPLASEVQTLTAEDGAVLQQELGRPVAHRRPLVLVAGERVRPERSGARILFLGDYQHHPNPEAARRLAGRVLPAVRAVEPAAELLLAGPNQERIADLAAVPGVRVLGYARNLPDLFGSVRCMLVPVWSGAGIRTKSLTALAHGLPVITNALGARGCEVPEPARVVVEDDAALAAATLRFLADPALAERASEQAHGWARTQLGPDGVAREQIDRIAEHLSLRPRARAPQPETAGNLR